MGATEAAVAGFYARQELEKRTKERDRYKKELDEALSRLENEGDGQLDSGSDR